MAVFDDEIVINSGLLKEVDADGMPILMDVIQKDLYNYPIESSVRETFSNGVDSIEEKLMAIAILSGKATIEDYYVESDRAEAKASKFNPDYYDLEWLDTSMNHVDIVYHKGYDNGKDMIFFKDFGVGLAGKRLEGFFRPGFSSKRLNKKMLGKYGLGSKSALSTNIEFYVLESWYNGHYTKVLIYDDYFKCVIPESVTVKKDKIYGKKLVDDKVIDSFDYINWSKSDRKNGVTVSFHAKSHNEDAYISAVQKQLMYFTDELKFSVVDTYGDVTYPNFKVEVLLDTPLFTISNNKFYSVPHILINKVNYSVIDFSELEMNKKYGSVAVKAGSNDVDMNASRETVRWTAKTKKFIQSVTEAASVMTGELLEKELDAIKNPFKRAAMASSWRIQRSGSRQEQIIEQLKNFSGASEISVPVNPRDYMDEEEIPANYRKSVFSIGDFYNVFSACKAINVSISDYNASVIKPGIRGVDWEHCVYRIEEKEDKVETLSIAEASYIKKIAGFSSFGHIGVPNKKYTAKSYEEFKDDMIDPKANVQYDKSYIKKMYIKYVSEQSRNTFLLKLFKKILIKNCIKDPYEDTEGLKAFIKENLILSDNKLVSKDDNTATSYIIQRKDSRTAEREKFAQLKKEKKVIAVKVGHRGYGSKEISYNLLDVHTDTIPDITGTIIYGFQEDRMLMDFMGCFLPHNNYSKGLQDGNIILIAKENQKFFNLDNFIHINNIIKTMHIVDKETNRLTLKFGPEVVKIMTNIKLVELTKQFPLAAIVSDSDLVTYIGRAIPKYHSILRKCYEYITFLGLSIDSFFVSGEDKANIIAETFISNKSDGYRRQLIVEFVRSLQDISYIQELPMSELTGNSKVLVNSFESVDVHIYDKDTINKFIQILESDSENIIKALVQYSVKRAVNPLFSFITSKFPIEIEEDVIEVVEDTKDDLEDTDAENASLNDCCV